MKRDALPSVLPIAREQAGVASSWREVLGALGLALVWIGFCYYDTAAAMVGIWERSETFAHGFVVAPISLWLIWRIRARLRSIPPRPSWIVFPLLATAGFGWLLGQVGAVNAITQFAFVAMLVLAVPAILGMRVTREMMFPLGFLFFSVPFGEFLLPTLMSHTADFTVLAIRESGVPVYREGLQFVIPTGRWSIVEACSGIRYLIASLMVGTLFAYLNYTTLWRRLAFVGVAIAVPIVANWLRAYMIVMLGHLSDNRIATGVDHIIYGWLFFGIVMLVMFAIGARWREPDRAAVTSAPIARAVNARSVSAARLWTATLGVMAITLVWPLADRAIQAHDADASATLGTIVVPGWQSTPASGGDFTPHFEAPSAVRHEDLRKDDRVVGLYVAYYRGQNAEHKLVSSDNVLVRSNDQTWHALESGVRQMDIGGTPTKVSAAQLRAVDGRTLATRQWYWVDGTLISSDAIAKARIAWSRILGRGDDSAVIVVYARGDVGSDPDETLRQFTREAWPAVAAALADAKTRSRRAAT